MCQLFSGRDRVVRHFRSLSLRHSATEVFLAIEKERNTENQEFSGVSLSIAVSLKARQLKLIT
jgi:hypothetical protein